jgi:Zn-dependent protease with chaperone function
MGRISKMGRLLPYLKRLWATDIALTTLLIFLLIYIFLLFPTGQIGSVRVLANLFFSLILITGAIAATRNRVFRLLVLSWGLLAFVFLWVRHLFPHQALIFLTTCLSLFFLVLLALLILGQAFREGPTTSHRITGAVAVYLLLGLIWSLAYYLVALPIPEAFAVQGPFTRGDGEALQSHLIYFSFVTLTTLGYGDIVAVHPMARMLAILQGVTGQLFPAILIARLVSLHVQTRRKP